MCPSGFRVSGPPGPGVDGGGGQTFTKTFVMYVQNFIKIGAGVWISITPSHTNRQTDKQTSVHPFLYREKKMLGLLTWPSAEESDLVTIGHTAATNVKA